MPKKYQKINWEIEKIWYYTRTSTPDRKNTFVTPTAKNDGELHLIEQVISLVQTTRYPSDITRIRLPVWWCLKDLL